MHPEGDGASADFWNMPRASTRWDCAELEEVQAQVRTPRMKSSREAAKDGEDRDHRSQPQFRRRSRFVAGERSRIDAHRFERLDPGRLAAPESAAIQRAVPPGSGARTA